MSKIERLETVIVEYKTSDGLKFDKKEAAELHEEELSNGITIASYNRTLNFLHERIKEDFRRVHPGKRHIFFIKFDHCVDDCIKRFINNPIKIKT
jgi:hypothetical protein